MPDHDQIVEWLEKLRIREVIERSMRHVDDRDGPRLATLFAEDGVMQLAGMVFSGRDAIRAMFGPESPPPWTAPGELLKQPRSAHRGSNPVIDIDGDLATAETDLLVLEREESGRPKIVLVARYRDRLVRGGDGWVITNRTGVSIARPGEEGTDAEWARAFERMPDALRETFRNE